MDGLSNAGTSGYCHLNSTASSASSRRFLSKVPALSSLLRLSLMQVLYTVKA